ncbi:DUF262 domain-containing protein [Micromonospora sp. NPDC002411]
MKTTATNKKVRELMTALREETLVPRPYFQRRLVWTARHKQLFIKTVLDGYPFPEIFLCDGEVDLETGIGTQLVVDGQQRITTLYQYFVGSDDLRLGDVPRYRDLSEPEKQAFLDYEVVVRDLGRLSDEDVRDVFHRMNSTNYSLNAMEVNNARFNGALKQFAEEVSKWSFFEDHRVFTLVDVRRMNDVRWALTLLITLLSGYFNRDSEHEAFLRRYNDDLPEKDRLHAELEETLNLIDRLELDPGSRAWQKNDLLTLVVEIYRRDPRLLLDQDALGESLRSFYAAVDAVSDGVKPTAWEDDAPAYHAAVISGSNERARRLRRAAAIAKVIDPYFPTLSAKTPSKP